MQRYEYPAHHARVNLYNEVGKTIWYRGNPLRGVLTFMNKKPWPAFASQGFSCFELLVMILQWI
jgi:hypothetical protein